MQWLAFTWLWLWGWGLVDLFARACATCVGVGRLCSGFVGLVELRWLLFSRWVSVLCLGLDWLRSIILVLLARLLGVVYSGFLWLLVVWYVLVLLVCVC